jgi:hypothetical protein
MGPIAQTQCLGLYPNPLARTSLFWKPKMLLGCKTDTKRQHKGSRALTQIKNTRISSKKHLNYPQARCLMPSDKRACVQLVSRHERYFQANETKFWIRSIWVRSSIKFERESMLLTLIPGWAASRLRSSPSPLAWCHHTVGLAHLWSQNFIVYTRVASKSCIQAVDVYSCSEMPQNNCRHAAQSKKIELPEKSTEEK